MTVREKVAILTNFVPPYRAPAYRALARRVESLDVHVDVPMEQNRSWAVDWEDISVTVGRGVSLVRKKGSRHVATSVEPSTLHVATSVVPFLIRSFPDIVITSEFGPRTLQAAIFCLLTRRPKLVVWATLSEWTELNRSTIQRRLRKVVLKLADGVICNGASGMAYIRGFNAEVPIKVISQVAHPEFLEIERMRGEEKKYDFVVVGQLVPAKGVAQFLNSVRRVGGNPRVALVGSGSDEVVLRSLVDNLGLDCAFLGELERSDVIATMIKSRYMVFPTLADEWGLVVNEALSLAVPVIGSRYSQAVVELVNPRNGWEVDPFDDVSFGAVLHEALTLGADDYRSLQSQCEESVSHLTPAHFADQLTAFIQELTDGRDHAAG